MFLATVMLLLWLVDVMLNREVNDPSRYRVPADKTILILGNSHSECALDDSIIDHSVNFAQSGDCYFYTYYKAKKLLDVNPNLKTVILEYNNNCFFSEMDKWMYDEQHIGYKLPKFTHYMSLEDKLYLFYKNPGSYFIAYRDAIKMKLKLSLKKSLETMVFLEWGEFRKNEKVADKNAFSKEALLAAGQGFYSDSSISKVDLSYLKSIHDLCRSKQVKVILFRSPVHPSFPLVNEQELQAMRQTEFKDLAFWDYLHFPLADSLFVDPQHLNYKGAMLFSDTINHRFAIKK
jgi:hypothetical protein